MATSAPGYAYMTGTLRIIVAESDGYLSEYVDITIEGLINNNLPPPK